MREALGSSPTATEVLRRIEAGEVGARLQASAGERGVAFSRETEEESASVRRARGVINRFLGEGMDEIGRKISRTAARFMPDPIIEPRFASSS